MSHISLSLRTILEDFQNGTCARYGRKGKARVTS